MNKLEKQIWTPDGYSHQRIFITRKLKELGNIRIDTLIQNAVKARENAYVPVTGYKVGASLLDVEGNFWDGANIEFVTLSATFHAEGIAIAKAASSGIITRVSRRFVDAIAVVHEGDSSPCCECRQKLLQFSDNCVVFVADTEGILRRITSLQLLTPDAFTPTHLGQ